MAPRSRNADAAGDEAAFEEALKAHESDFSEEFTGILASLMQQVEQQGIQDANSGEILKRLEKIYRVILKRSMQKNLGK